MLSVFPWNALDEILDLIESVSKGFPTYPYNKSLLYPAHNFVLHGRSSKLHGKTSFVREDYVASLKVKIII